MAALGNTEPIDPGVRARQEAQALQTQRRLALVDAANPPPVPVEAPKVSWGEVIPVEWRVMAAVGLLFSVTLITVAALMGHGTLHVPDLVYKGFKYSAMIVGTADVLAIPAVAYYGHTEKKTRQAVRTALANQPPPENLSPPSARPPSQQRRGAPVNRAGAAPPLAARPAPPPIAPAAWDSRLADPLRKQGIHYNLDSELPGDRIANTSGVGYAWLQLPTFGRYDPRDCGFAQDHLMAARLPPGQLAAFPDMLQRWFKENHVTKHAECFFMVFNNTQQLEDFRRNLSMHAMALPEYDRKNPSCPIGEPSGVEPYGKDTSEGRQGITTPCDMALFDPIGIELSDGSSAIGNGGENRVSHCTLDVHGKRNRAPALSPHVGEFQISEGTSVSMAFFGVLLPARGRGIAIHALILNDDKPATPGAALKEAIAKESINAFLAHLDAKSFPLRAKVRKTFTQPPPA